MSPLVRAKLHAARLALATRVLPYPGTDPDWLVMWSNFARVVAEVIDVELWQLVTLAALLGAAQLGAALAAAA